MIIVKLDGRLFSFCHKSLVSAVLVKYVIDELKLEDEFQRIKNDHPEALRKRATLVVLGPSVTRVYKPGTKKQLEPVLDSIAIDELKKMKNQEEFKHWFEKELDKIASEIIKTNSDNKKIFPGYKWGHASKLLTLHNRELVLNSHYFSDNEVTRIAPWLYVPIDSLVMKRIRQLGINLKFSRINQIDSATKFYFIQDLLGKSAAVVDIPRIWFDDVWGDRQ